MINPLIQYAQPPNLMSIFDARMEGRRKRLVNLLVQYFLHLFGHTHGYLKIHVCDVYNIKFSDRETLLVHQDF